MQLEKCHSVYTCLSYNFNFHKIFLVIPANNNVCLHFGHVFGVVLVHEVDVDFDGLAGGNV